MSKTYDEIVKEGGAECPYCGKRMLKENGCDCNYLIISGKEYKRIRYGEDHPGYELSDRCHDCGCKKGYYHHPNCDMETCPSCGHQLLSCDCHLQYVAKK